MVTFTELGLCEPLLKAITELGFTQPTDIQEQTIPLSLEGRDILAGSKTGSGKTLAFGAGIIQNCEPGQGIQSIILTPTRELAEQIAENMKLFSKHKKLKFVKVYGGVAIEPQIEKLQVSDVIIGTPGRVLDHIQRQTMDLSKVKVLVLDEADRMLDMGFIDDVRKIVAECPKQRQTLFFSATIPEDIRELALNYMDNPEQITGDWYVDPKKLHQEYYDVQDKVKFSLLVHLLKNENTKLVMVFCNSQRTTDFVEQNLKANGIEAKALHGKIPQSKRNKILASFHSKDVHVLCCTDVAARGLDIAGVSHVYNYDIPHDSRQYVHRIGRTARAGKEGKAVNLLTNKDHENFTRVLRDNDVDVKKMETPDIPRAKVTFTGKRNNRNFQRRDDRRRSDKPRNRIGRAPQFGS